MSCFADDPLKNITLFWRCIMCKFSRILYTFGVVFTLFALAFAGCDMTVAEKPAEEPVITVDPKVTTPSPYKDGDELTLTIEASSPDGGALTYEWYKFTNNSEYTGKTGTLASTGKDYKLTVTAGIYNFYVIVTNGKGKTASVQSKRLSFGVGGEGDAQYPVIISQPSGGTYYSGTTVTLDPISVIAEVSDGGTLSYQWYKSEEDENDGGEIIAGATLAAYTPQITAVGTYYFYVVVTNTNPDAVGNQAASLPSEPVTIFILVTEDKTANATFTVNPVTKYQYVRGFGGMDTPWDNVKAVNIQDYETMYNPDKLGYNIMRIMILANNVDIDKTMSDLVEGYYSEEDGTWVDPLRPDYYEGVKIVNKYGGYVLASPWSPPAVWKTNNDIKGGGKLKTANYQDFADYLNNFSKHMYDKGAPIYAISMQNEPSYTTTQYEGCEYTSTEHRDWWLAVGRFTDRGPKGWGGGKEQPTVRTMSGESHNEISWQTPAMQNTTTRGYIDIVGRHIYGSWVNPTTAFDFLGNGKEVWMTEHNVNGGNATAYPFDSTWNYVWKFMNEIDLTIRLNNENAFVWWTAKRFYSMIGDGDYATTEHQILPRGYGLSHYAKFAKEMWRCELTGSGTLADGTTTITENILNGTTSGNTDTKVKATAFVSEDGNTISVIMYTPTSDAGASGRDMGTVKIQLPETFTIRKAAAMRTTGSDRIAQNKTESVTVGSDRHSAYVTLPSANILSVRFTK
jgi:O-glycosyl hydrolase